MRPPSVDALARELAPTGLPHPLLVEVARAAIADGDPGSAAARAEALRRTLLAPVVNATGVLLHTNLGRAPLTLAARDKEFGGGEPARYANVELDLATGRRGNRLEHAAALLARAAGAEAALVVNNGAAAVLLALRTIARGRPVIVSRGELVEIGGGFRIPEVMGESGAVLVEVGTTNRTRLSDYANALSAHPDAVLLKVHPSNYRIEGFVAAVTVAELATLGAPVLVDLGSGLLDAATPWLAGGPPPWLRDEPAVRQTIAQGAGLVTFSGDKLLGGPQAGLIAGTRDLVQRCARQPLARALRPGGLVLAALQETALAYLHREGDAIPFWRMACAPVSELTARAEALGVGRVVECTSVAGGGSAPGLDIPSAGLALRGDHSAALRANDPPIVARVHAGETILDLRTVDAADDALLVKAVASLGDIATR